MDVAVGILVNRDGTLLLASRPHGKPYPGFWEFPGGKIEAGETVADALRRELHEELGIEVGPVFPWVLRTHDYPHALVRLHFCRVFEWAGVLHAREHQQFGFFRSRALPTPLLPATVPVLRGLELPAVYAISAAARLGCEEFLKRLDLALNAGLKLVQLREPDLAFDELASLFKKTLQSTRRAKATLLVNSRHPRAWWDQADGVHLTAQAAASIVRRPSCQWVGASAHDASELEHAGKIGADFAVLGPVHPTGSHPGAAAIGWRGFEQVAADTAIPVYAIGNLQPSDVATAMQHGAHGVAALSNAWLPSQCFDVGVSAAGVSSTFSAAAPRTT